MSFIERKIDEIGRVALPIDFRNAMGVSAGDTVVISMEDDRIIISSKQNSCKLCGSTENVHTELHICNKCIDTVKSSK